MTDTPESKPKRLTMFAVDSKDFARFLVAKGAGKDENCPLCQGDDWTILCPDDDGPTLRLGMPVRNRPDMFYMSTFGYFCNSCGYLRTHMASTVHEWVENNPRPDSDLIDDDDSSAGEASDE